MANDPQQQNAPRGQARQTGRAVQPPVPVRNRRESLGATPSSAPGSRAHARPDRNMGNARPGAHPASAKGRPPRHKTNRKRCGRAPLAAAAVVAVLLVGAYGAGIYLFSTRCYPNTAIAGTDIGLADASEAASRIEANVKDYELSIEGDGFSWSYKPDAASDIIDAWAAAERAIASNEPLAWPARLAQALMEGSAGSDAIRANKDAEEQEVELPESFDRDAFSAELRQALDAFNADRPGTFDAAGAYDTETKTFTVERAKANRKLDADAVESAALRAIASLTPTVALDEQSFAPLADGASDEELQAACDAANELIGTDVDLTMGGTTVATLDGEQLAQWITFDDALAPTLSTDPVAAWVRQLATQLDTIGSQRSYTRPDGKQVTVSGGSFGWESDEAKLVEALKNAVATKQTGSIEVPCVQTADVYRAFGQPDWDAYIDIDLTEQHARYYDASGNLLWESGVITGNPNNGDATPTGVYAINSNDGASVLIGEKDPKTGKPKYRSPVDYWMPFVGNLIGLHDANWQAPSEFSNPNAYTYVGSHGCVNLPVDKAAQLHDLIGVGLCVVVHT